MLRVSLFLFLVLVSHQVNADLIRAVRSSNFSTNSSLYEVDLTTGAGTFLGSIASSRVSAIAFDSAGNLYGSDARNDRLLRIDAMTGASTVIGAFGLSDITGLAWDRVSGVMYGWDGFSERLATINLSTGAATAIGAFGAGDSHIEGIEFDGTGRLFGVQDTNNDSLVRIDIGDSTVSDVGRLGVSGSPTGLAFNHRTGLMYEVDGENDHLNRMSLDFGRALSVGPLGFNNVSGIAISNVPEPSSLAILGIGLPMLLYRRR